MLSLIVIVQLGKVVAKVTSEFKFITRVKDFPETGPRGILE